MHPGIRAQRATGVVRRRRRREERVMKRHKGAEITISNLARGRQDGRSHAWEQRTGENSEEEPAIQKAATPAVRAITA